jgi:hypothetical protein
MDNHNTPGYLYLSPNYRARLADPVAYNNALATLFGTETRQQRAAERPYTPPRLKLGHLGEMLDQAATAVLAIIRENLAPVPNVRDYQEQRELRNYQIGDTFAREVDLFEAGHIDDTERLLAGEILHRAQQKFPWPEPASCAGLALIDGFLLEFITAIKPLLATQADLLAEAAH